MANYELGFSYDIPTFDFQLPSYDFQLPSYDFQLPSFDFQTPDFSSQFQTYDFGSIASGNYDFSIPQIPDFKAPEIGYDYNFPSLEIPAVDEFVADFSNITYPDLNIFNESFSLPPLSPETIASIEKDAAYDAAETAVRYFGGTPEEILNNINFGGVASIGPVTGGGDVPDILGFLGTTAPGAVGGEQGDILSFLGVPPVNFDLMEISAPSVAGGLSLGAGASSILDRFESQTPSMSNVITPRPAEPEQPSAFSISGGIGMVEDFLKDKAVDFLKTREGEDPYASLRNMGDMFKAVGEAGSTLGRAGQQAAEQFAPVANALRNAGSSSQASSSGGGGFGLTDILKTLAGAGGALGNLLQGRGGSGGGSSTAQRPSTTPGGPSPTPTPLTRPGGTNWGLLALLAFGGLILLSDDGKTENVPVLTNGKKRNRRTPSPRKSSGPLLAGPKRSPRSTGAALK